MFRNELFENRTEAGKKLADALEKFSDRDVIILAIPRGGIVVGYEIAKRLHAPLLFLENFEHHINLNWLLVL